MFFAPPRTYEFKAGLIPFLPKIHQKSTAMCNGYTAAR